MPESLQQKIDRGARLAGTTLTLPGVTHAELVAEPFDLIWIDLEHAALGRMQAQEAMIGAQAVGTHPLVRLAADDLNLMAPMLDAGADGMVLADVSLPETVAAIVDRIEHPPAGNRGWGPRRLASRGRATSTESARPSLWAQIESAAGVERIAEIAAVPGLNIICVGAADLSIALGTPLDLKSAPVGEAIARVRKECEQAGATFALAGALDGAPSELCAGVQILVHGTDAKFCTGAVDSAAAWLREVLDHGQEPSSD